MKSVSSDQKEEPKAPPPNHKEIFLDDIIHHTPKLLAGKIGKKPLFSDREVITLSLAQHWRMR